MGGTPRSGEVMTFSPIDRSFHVQHSSILSMNTHAYPGKDLSLSQLVFALNEELKRVAHSPSYVAGFVHVERPR